MGVKKSPAILFYGNFEKCRAAKIFSYLLKATLSGDKMVILELSIQYRLHKNMLPKTAVFWKNSERLTKKFTIQSSSNLFSSEKGKNIFFILYSAAEGGYAFTFYPES